MTGRGLITALSCVRRASTTAKPAAAAAARSPRHPRNPRPSRQGKPAYQANKQHPKPRSNSENPSPRQPLDIPTRLKVLFSRPSTSTAPATYNVSTLILTIGPVFAADRHLLDPFLYDIATSLSPDKGKASSRDAAGAELITDILAYCWVRSNQIKPSPFTVHQMSEFALRYARRLVGLALEGRDAQHLMDHLMTNLRLYKEANFILSPAMFAAWAVLRQDLDQKETPIQFIPPKKEEVFKALNSVLGIRDAEFEHYTGSVEELLKANSGCVEDIPHSPEQLDVMLGAMRIGQMTKEAVALWGKYKESMKAEKRGEHPVPDVDKAKDARVRSLTSFLRFFSRSPALRRLPTEEQELLQYRNEVLSYIPRPYPAAIHHVLLVHRARMDEEGRDFRVVQSLDDEVVDEIRDKERATEDLEAVWKMAGEEGARDLKSYMLYMEGLTKVGDAIKLGRAWEELVRDQACKEAFHLEEGKDKSFPPTRALNHMISCAFLIPYEGTQIALDLFEQVIRPDSAISCDIVTINIVLRHHARRAVVPSMLALLPLAQQHGLTPDVATYTVLLQGLLRAGELRMAIKTLETMYAQGIPPNERTISLLISDLAKNGDRKGLRAAEELMREMRVLQMKVGEVPWTSLISGYFRGGWDVEAWEAIRRMDDAGVPLNRVGHNMVLRELGERVHSSIPFRARPPVVRPPVEPTERSLLIRWFRRMVKTVTPNSDTYLIVLTPLVRAQRWAEADEVVAEMKTRGFVAEKAALRAILNRVKLRKKEWN